MDSIAVAVFLYALRLQFDNLSDGLVIDRLAYVHIFLGYFCWPTCVDKNNAIWSLL